MADIVSTSFALAPTTDKSLRIAGEEYLRKLSIGNSWTSIRIGVMCAMTPDGTNNLSACQFFVGMCSADGTFANTAGLTAASTTNSIGYDFFYRSTNEAATYATSSSLVYYVPANNGGSAYRRVATTVTTTGNNTTHNIGIVSNTGATQRRSPHYIDITKGSPNYTLQRWGASSAVGANMTRDFSLAHFLGGFDTATPVLDGVTFVNTEGSLALAASEAAGNLDTVSVYWNRTGFPMDIYAIAVKRLS